ncbi:MAG: hypothetical protein V9G14_05280 [Cypionkella sp.]
MRELALHQQPRAGGQIYRNVGNGDPRPWPGKDHAAGSGLLTGLDHPHIRSEYFATVGRIEAGARAIRPFLDAAPTPLPEILPAAKCCWQRPDRRVAAFFASADLAGRYQGSCGHEHGLGSLDASGIASRRCLR